MSRYDTSKIIKDKKTKKRKYETVLYPSISRSSEDIYIISRIGDRLDNLAFKYYDDTSKWWIIAQANELGKGTLIVPSGKQIRIPANVDDIENEIESFNSNQ